MCLVLVLFLAFVLLVLLRLGSCLVGPVVGFLCSILAWGYKVFKLISLIFRLQTYGVVLLVYSWMFVFCLVVVLVSCWVCFNILQVSWVNLVALLAVCTGLGLVLVCFCVFVAFWAFGCAGYVVG